MRLSTLRTILRLYPELPVRLILPEGDAIAAQFHVTEVGHVVRRFTDCGGTIRRAESCLLQTWVASNDAEHRLCAEKLATILERAAGVLPPDDLEVEVEYEPGCLAQYTLDHAQALDGELRFYLAHKRTDCLAREACGLSPAGEGAGHDCGTREAGCC